MSNKEIQYDPEQDFNEDEDTPLTDLTHLGHKRIYLVLGDEYLYNPCIDWRKDEINWCEDKINLQDIEYIRGDIHENVKSELISIINEMHNEIMILKR